MIFISNTMNTWTRILKKLVQMLYSYKQFFLWLIVSNNCVLGFAMAISHPSVNILELKTNESEIKHAWTVIINFLIVYIRMYNSVTFIIYYQYEWKQILKVLYVSKRKYIFICCLGQHSSDITVVVLHHNSLILIFFFLRKDKIFGKYSSVL